MFILWRNLWRKKRQKKKTVFTLKISYSPFNDTSWKLVQFALTTIWITVSGPQRSSRFEPLPTFTPLVSLFQTNPYILL